MSANQWIKEFEDGKLKLSELLRRLVDRIESLESRCAGLERENKRLKGRLAEYEPNAEQQKQDSGDDATHYGLEADARRKDLKQRKKKLKKSPGRRPTDLKFKEAEVYERIVHPQAPEDRLRLVSRRVAWRLVGGRAVLTGYEIYSAPGYPPPPIDGLPARSEYGLEIGVVLAFLTYLTGISLNKACALLQFFCGLTLSKSQADALLTRLARDWSGAFDSLCDLLAFQAVVYTDETGWKVGKDGSSLWLFISQQATVYLYGRRKNAATLEEMLDAEFAGTVVSDDAVVYQRFQKAQKCWAHLLRKAIKLTLLYPRRTRYQRLCEGLFELFRDGKRAAADKRLGDAGRQRRRQDLENRLAELLVQFRDTLPSSVKGPERTFFNLVCELRRLMIDDELFTFVTEEGVEPTNNVSERGLRSSALDREAKRTSKTARGAKRRSVIVSVLESLRRALDEFSLQSVLDEAQRWMRAGRSRFESLLASQKRQAKLALDSG